MKFRAIILAFVFLFGGSGFSIDIAQCCSKISGISIGFSQAETSEGASCCSVRKSGKSCCEEIVFQTVINPVLGLHKTTVPVFKAGEHFFPPLAWSFPAVQNRFVVLASDYDDFDHHYPLPVLLRKRVLQI